MKRLLIPIIVFVSLVTPALAQDAVLLYDVDFGSPPHVIGQAPVLGTDPAPRQTLTRIVFGNPIVVENLGSLADQPMHLAGPGSTQFDYSQVEMGIASEFDGFSEDFPRYLIEMDVLVELLQDDDFTIFLDTPNVRNIYFGPDGRISVTDPIRYTYTVGTYSTTVSTKLLVDVDLTKEIWVVSINGAVIYSGDFNADRFNKIRLSLARSSQNIVAVDNIKVYGLYESAALSGFKIIGLENVAENSHTHYRAIASYNNGCELDVTHLTEWNITPNTFASIDSYGNLVTNTVNRQSEMLDLYASYSEGDTTFEVLKPISIFPVCPKGNALKFDGSDDYVSLGDVNEFEFSTNDFTITCWIYPNGHGTVISKYNWTSQQDLRQEWKLEVGYLGDIIFRRSNLSSMFSVRFLSSFPYGHLNQWTHVVVVKKDYTMRLYINGVHVSINSTEENIVGKTAHIFIGAVISSYVDGMSHIFDGLIDEVAIYDKALSIEEITQTMYSNLSGQETGLIAYWDFDEGEGQTLTDLSGHDHHCYLGGSPLEPDDCDPQWVVSSAPLSTCTRMELIERNWSGTLTIKEHVREKLQAALDVEQATLELLEDLFKADEYHELDKRQLIRAKRTIHSAMQHQEQSLNALDKSIHKLEEGQEVFDTSP